MGRFKNSKLEKYWHQLFEFGVFIKGFNGIWEIIGGFLVLFLRQAVFSDLFYSLARNELLEDPNDRVINFIARAINGFSSGAKLFVGFYVLFHGLLNIFLAVQLYRNKLWAYLATLGFMTLFVCYQIYRIMANHSTALIVITVFDLLFMLITWHEYRYRRNMKLEPF
jgi:uncharacterized membrane protein